MKTAEEWKAERWEGEDWIVTGFGFQHPGTFNRHEAELIARTLKLVTSTIQADARADLLAENIRLTQACEKEFASVQELSAENEKLKKDTEAWINCRNIEVAHFQGYTVDGKELTGEDCVCSACATRRRFSKEITDRDQLLCQKNEALKRAQRAFRLQFARNAAEIETLNSPYDKALSPTITSQYVKKEIAEKLAGILKQSLIAYEYEDKFRPNECDSEMAQIREALSLYEQSNKCSNPPPS